MVEPLFAEHFTWQSEEWRELKKLRHHLMTRVTVAPCPPPTPFPLPSS